MTPARKKILFLTGTRADFGKLKPLMRAVEGCGQYEVSIFVTGMHTLTRHGWTAKEVLRAGFGDVHVFYNQHKGESMDRILAFTIEGLSRYVAEKQPDMIVVHGDRAEALAGAIVGAMRNILVAHVEGGELSGTIDGALRHCISKLAHVHFVANAEAAARLEALGENRTSIFAIGSPEADVMASAGLPTLMQVRARYAIAFDSYAIVSFHPVTTEQELLGHQAAALVEALVESKRSYVVIQPNNDEGCDTIFRAYESIRGESAFRFFPSLRFEYYLTLLRHAEFVIGNSSSGIREAPFYGVPSINLGSRQQDRFSAPSVRNAEGAKPAILAAIAEALRTPRAAPSLHFGVGDSARGFLEALAGPVLWRTPLQKRFWRQTSEANSDSDQNPRAHSGARGIETAAPQKSLLT